MPSYLSKPTSTRLSSSPRLHESRLYENVYAGDYDAGRGRQSADDGEEEETLYE